MADQRALDAIGRIDRALARIEAAGARQPAATAPAEDLEAARDAHQRLRGRVEGAIGQIDRLLETGSPR